MYICYLLCCSSGLGILIIFLFYHSFCSLTLFWVLLERSILQVKLILTLRNKYGIISVVDKLLVLILEMWYLIRENYNLTVTTWAHVPQKHGMQFSLKMDSNITFIKFIFPLPDRRLQVKPQQQLYFGQTKLLNLIQRHMPEISVWPTIL